MENDILDALEDIGYDGPMLEDGCMEKALDGGPKSVEYTTLVEWLSKELKTLCKLEEHVNAIASADDSSSFLLEVSSFLKELGCCYSCLIEGHLSDRLNSKENRMLLLDFLLTELEAARMVSVNKPDDSKTMQVHLVGSIASYIDHQDDNPFDSNAVEIAECAVDEDSCLQLADNSSSEIDTSSHVADHSYPPFSENSVFSQSFSTYYTQPSTHSDSISSTSLTQSAILSQHSFSSLKQHSNNSNSLPSLPQNSNHSTSFNENTVLQDVTNSPSLLIQNSSKINHRAFTHSPSLLTQHSSQINLGSSSKLQSQNSTQHQPVQINQLASSFLHTPKHKVSRRPLPLPPSITSSSSNVSPNSNNTSQKMSHTRVKRSSIETTCATEADQRMKLSQQEHDIKLQILQEELQAEKYKQQAADKWKYEKILFALKIKTARHKEQKAKAQTQRVTSKNHNFEWNLNVEEENISEPSDNDENPQDSSF